MKKQKTQEYEKISRDKASKQVGKEDSDSDSDEEDPDIQKNTDDNSFTNKDPRVRTNIRNLRLREDTAVYLRNLDLNSAHYDPKSRMMKDNPNPNLPED